MRVADRHVRRVGGGSAHQGPILRTNNRASLSPLGDVMTVNIMCTKLASAVYNMAP